ncbi:hypothetical protein GL263_15365 [Streptomyces durbertensis]|uniref:Uncharacterized protein n=1 Tax=Streptomyces durbertensis TaxID=2448886 RepID=A0ABR6EK98_9ACTN|nr:hypothetical protein [Streptomyces durbertensis]MBB1244934.1 hypothetical protein [Streptomyces durbertensis]
MATDTSQQAGAAHLHAVPDRRDLLYDVRARQAVLPIILRHPDGRRTETILVLDGNQMQLVAIQLEQAIDKRQSAGHLPPLYGSGQAPGGGVER